MSIFEVSYATPNFPHEITGTIVPDEGRVQSWLYDYVDDPQPLIPTLLTEMAIETSVDDLIRLHEKRRLAAIATFGLVTDYSDTEPGPTHLAVLSLRLGINLIQLKKPSGFPSLHNDWVPNNPMREFYHRKTSLKSDGQTFAKFMDIELVKL